VELERLYDCLDLLHFPEPPMPDVGPLAPLAQRLARTVPVRSTGVILRGNCRWRRNLISEDDICSKSMFPCAEATTATKSGSVKIVQAAQIVSKRLCMGRGKAPNYSAVREVRATGSR